MPRHHDSTTNSALNKALAVIDVLVAAQGACTLSVITRTLGIPRQSAHRVLGQLEAAGLVRRSLDGQGYVVGRRLQSLAVEVMCARWRDGALHAHLSALVARVGETCNVGILDGDRVLYVERVECDWPLREQLAAGDRVPVHATAIGKLLLAFLPSRPRMRLLGALDLVRFTSHTITRRDDLSAALRVIRRQGWSINNEENTDGLMGIAVPVRDGTGRVVAGLSMHAPSARVSLDAARALRPALEDTATALGRDLADDAAQAAGEAEPGGGSTAGHDHRSVRD